MSVTGHDMNRFLNYICDDFLLSLSLTMVGASDALEESKTGVNKSAIVDLVDFGNVAEELKTFGKDCKYRQLLFSSYLTLFRI